MKKFLISVLEVVEIAAIAIGAVFVIRSFLVQPFLVSGDSMVPTFRNGDYLLIDELTYKVRVPERGEVVVFRYPNDPSVYFIKRIVGLPGEKVEIKNNHVIVHNDAHPDGITLDESYLPAGLLTSDKPLTEVSPGEYFVMGDNRPYSFDSRSWGLLPGNDLVGLVRLRLWPPTQVHIFEAPQYK